MVAPICPHERSDLAKSLGLGRMAGMKAAPKKAAAKRASKKSQPRPDASRGFEVSSETSTQWKVSMRKSNSIGVGHSDPAWDGGHRKRPKRHETMWRHCHV